ncbi:MAG: rRNA pseudouridine synthase [Planctomycetes bacterium]|nr:rRNA pseudouridine synthase [Planctomycetota bacterium]MCW8135071.1 rRNA pseudouridine synthase [Planctomycetota bacterium]
MSHDDSTKERLQKILARAGYGSRRACEELIVEGRVTVNDQIVSVLGVRADPLRDVITVDGERLSLPKSAYWILHKREGVAFTDTEGDDAFKELIPGEQGRLFSVGRLDRGSRGLMVITNDGRVANVLTHPRYKVPKVYKLVVGGSLGKEAASNIERALFYAFNGGKFEPLRITERSAARSEVWITVYAGLPPALRDIFYKYGHPLKAITRERIGVIELSDLPAGAVRKLRGDETRIMLSYVEDAETGKTDYENEPVSPSRFPREATGFKRKKIGARTTSHGGQKKTSARVHSRRPGDRSQGDGKPRGDRPPRRDGQKRSPPGTRPPRRDRGPRRG